MSEADRTAIATANARSERLCPACGKSNTFVGMPTSYRCRHCNQEMAHVDCAPNGMVRGVFGWLLLPGATVLGRYRVESLLGKGGFGATYRVEDLQLSGRRRALKEVPVPLFDEQETALLSRLEHPAIPDILERQVVDGMVYQVLKFGGSRSLEEERRRRPGGRVPLEALLPWMRQLCDVLAYLHSQDPPVIHRDLKPSNILLDDDGRITLVDFGIAKQAVEGGRTRTVAQATTPGYSPPEQHSQMGTDQRSDVYAFGATFYALLTGKVPPDAYSIASGLETLAPPSELVPGVPPLLEDALLQALSLNRNYRQQSMAEFVEVLEALAPAERASVPTPGETLTQTQLASQVAAQSAASLRASRPAPSSLKIPRTEPGGPPEPSELPAEPAPALAARQPRTIGWIGAAALLAALAAGGYWLSKDKPAAGPQAEKPPAAQQPASPPNPAMPPAVPPSAPPAPVAPAAQPEAPAAPNPAAPPAVPPSAPPAPVAPAAQPEAPAAPAQPPAAAPVPAQPPGGSVEDMLKNRQAAPPPETQPPSAPHKAKAKPPRAVHEHAAKRPHKPAAGEAWSPPSRPSAAPSGSPGCSLRDMSRGKCY